MKKVKIEDLANIAPDCKFKEDENLKYFRKLIKSDIKHAKKDGFYSATGVCIPIGICLDEYVFVTDEDFDKYFKKYNYERI